MRICSVTLAGPGTEDIIGDALRSVPWVDGCIVYDTTPGRSEGSPLHDLTYAICGDRWVWAKVSWKDDFAMMRNAALEGAENLRGYDWAVWLDTDERLVGDGDAILAYLASLPDHVCAVHAMDTRREYGKERFIRLPRRGKYIGLTHEYWSPDEGQIIASTDLLTFDELPRDRSGEAWAHKLERDDRLLKAQRQSEPNDPRWVYYAGDCAFLQGKPEKARELWKRCIPMGGWPEVRGWAGHRAATELIGEGKTKEALEVIGKALIHTSPYPELLYAAAVCYIRLEDFGNAFHWADLAARRGSFEGIGKHVRRSGYVYPPALWEGPFEVMSLACDGMEMTEAAMMARNKAEAAKRMRLHDSHGKIRG